MRSIVYIFLCFYVNQAVALTADEIMALQHSAYSKENDKKQRIDSKNFKDTKEKKPEKKVVDKKPAKSKKYTNKSKKVDNTNTVVTYDDLPSDRNKIDDQQQVISGTVTIDSVEITKRRYGIPPGTIIHGEIRRDIVSSEPSLAEIYITKSVVGALRTIPSGTIMFARMAVNSTTKRIEMFVEKGVTPKPDSYEFDISGIVRDEMNVSGISGIVEENKGETYKKGLNTGLHSLARGALSNMSPGNFVGNAARDGASDVIDENKKRSDTEVNTNIIIYASPQNIRIFVEKSL